MKNRMVIKIMMVIMGAIFLFSSVKVLRYHLERRAGEDYVESLAELAVVQYTQPPESQVPTSPVVEDTPEAITETATAEATEEVGEEATAEPAAPAPLYVDFDALQAQNPDIIAWIYCQDSPINYPVVQAEDNEYYLHRLPDGSENSGGTLFMDYRNASDMSDWNSVIYGHNMKDDSMFGTLPDYKTQSYFESHGELYLFTQERNYVIRVLAGFVTSADSDVYNEFCPTDEEMAELMSKWMDESDFVCEDYSGTPERIITLSTCSYEYDDARYVIIGALEEMTGISR